jgi:UDP-N-acetylmuramoyl-tripeptide--D-alanyl-D-alanine ligase
MPDTRPALVLAAGEIAAATGGRLLAGDPARAVDGFSIDSRTLRRGELFIAIRGDRFDGAAFAAESLAGGAGGVMIAQGTDAGVWQGRGGSPIVIEVADTTAALQELGRYVRRQSGARVTAITGSAGKTTTKETAAEFLGARYTVYRNRGNLNNHIGLPLSLLDLRARPDVAVVELGMNHAGEISRLVALAEPETRVWTNVGDAHLGFFSGPDAIAEAKAEILEGATSASLLVANADDPRVMRHARRFAGRITTFGTADTAEVRAEHIEDLGTAGTRSALTTPAGRADLRVPLVGRGNLLNVLAAAAVALAMEVPLETIVERAAGLRPARHRGEVVELRDGVTLVDDSYNSSPTALRRALDVLAADRGHARRVAVLGEMLELGSFADELHRQCGRAAAAAGVAELLAVGGSAAEALAAAARDAGLGGHSRYVATSGEAAGIAAGMLRPGDLVLVKGSRGIRTDVIVDRIAAEWS